MTGSGEPDQEPIRELTERLRRMLDRVPLILTIQPDVLCAFHHRPRGFVPLRSAQQMRSLREAWLEQA